MLFDKFKYTSISIEGEETALTDEDGNLKEFVAGSRLGLHFSENSRPSDKYLYDLCLYDSELEKKNITTTDNDVVVFAKIPTKSVRIPLIDGATYSPDFMYVVKRDNDARELNLVIETKDYKNMNEIPLNQQFKIDGASKFFEQLKKDNYEVNFDVQLNDTQLSNLIKNL